MREWVLGKGREASQDEWQYRRAVGGAGKEQVSRAHRLDLEQGATRVDGACLCLRKYCCDY
eukprot:2053367-Pyramimonas_sp.AAC.2